MTFPKHINLTIEHNPHKSFYENAGEYIGDKFANDAWGDDDFVSIEDKQKCIETNDFWTIQWYPDTPVGFCYIVASTLEKALEKAND